jgi:hypothetical protein
MQENKDLVQEALIQMKNVEEAIAENAKGILQSTMKEEISQLVKESLSEQDDMEVELDTEMDSEPSDDMEVDNDDEMDMDVDLDMDMDMDSDDESPIDLTDASDEEILRVFKAMGEEDGIIVKKDGNDVHLTDNDADVEYLVKLGESEDEKIDETMNMDEIDEMDDVDTQSVIDAIFSKDGNSSDLEIDQEDEEVMYEIEFNESDDEDEDDEELDESEDLEEGEDLDESDDEDEDDEELDESEDLEEGEDLDESDDLEEGEDLDENWEESLDEAYNHKKVKKSETKEGKSKVKPKGVGIGSGPKFTYKDKAAGGFKEDKKQGPKSVGTGKAKFEYKKGANMDGKSKVIKKAETKEAARTLGMGSGFRKGGLPKPRAHSKVNSAIKESLEAEVKMLREKNEEYRKALNVFREKLNEVAIFNSNLAYATRIFTEHSTTKKEKINILRRFDNVETLKESKNLYKSIKEQLSKTETKSLSESVESKLVKNVSSGSSTTLIESKTYENPQFLRIKDLMSKM